MDVTPSTVPEVTVLFPCLNEERTIAECVRRARAALDGAGLRGEVLVADNGSTDASVALAEEAGARVVPVRGRGYGRALRAGLAAAAGDFVVFMDADLSYDPAYVPEFAAALRGGGDFVMGSRMRGKIDPGAMPPHHRWFGTPALTLLARALFHVPVSDINCGLRGVRREALARLDLHSDGMEFASEMILKAAHHRLRFAEIPIHFHCDQRGREPHLRSFRDGWRHLQLMLHYAPLWLFFLPGLLLAAGGLGTILAGFSLLPPVPAVLGGLGGLISVALGLQILLLGLTAQDRVTHPRWHDDSTLFRIVTRCRRLIMLENGVLVSLSTFALGMAVLAAALFRAGAGDAAAPPTPQQTVSLGMDTLRLAFLGAALGIAGVQLFFTCAFLGLFGRKSSSDTEALLPPPGGDAGAE